MKRTILGVRALDGAYELQLASGHAGKNGRKLLALRCEIHMNTATMRWIVTRKEKDKPLLGEGQIFSTLEEAVTEFNEL